MQTFFWTVYGIFRNEEPGFIKGCHHGKLSKFRLRGIYAIDSTTIQLAFCCIDWAKHRQRKVARQGHRLAVAEEWRNIFLKMEGGFGIVKTIVFYIERSWLWRSR